MLHGFGRIKKKNLFGLIDVKCAYGNPVYPPLIPELSGIPASILLSDAVKKTGQNRAFRHCRQTDW